MSRVAGRKEDLVLEHPEEVVSIALVLVVEEELGDLAEDEILHAMLNDVSRDSHGRLRRDVPVLIQETDQANVRPYWILLPVFERLAFSTPSLAGPEVKRPPPAISRRP